LENIISYTVDHSIVHPLSENLKNKVFKNRVYQELGEKLKESMLAIESDGIQFDMLLSNLPSADRVVSLLELNRNIFYIMHTTFSLEIEEMKKRKNIFVHIGELDIIKNYIRERILFLCLMGLQRIWMKLELIMLQVM